MPKKRKINEAQIMLIMRYVSAVLLIGFGWYAEVYWYQFRFISDGNSAAVAVAQGIALTLFLSVAAILKQSWWKWALIAGLVAYSVFATAAGQSYSLEIVRIQNTAESAKREAAERRIADIDSSIAAASNEISRLQGIREQGAATLADQSLWRTALANLNEDIAEQEAVINILTTEKLSIIDTGNIEPDDIYTRYSKLTGIPVTFIEAVFQLALSLFIALMAPVGLYMWPRSAPRPQVVRTRQREPKAHPYREFIRPWVEINWTAVRAGKSDPKIITRHGFFEHSARHGREFTDEIYDRIHADAISKNIVDGEKIMVYDEARSIRELGGV